MKQYKVNITDRALADMEDIYTYIAKHFQAPDTAQAQYDRIAAEIESLQMFPERYPLFDSQPERDMGMRKLLVDNWTARVYAGGGTGMRERLKAAPREASI